ncbi:hypothetical protein BLNAU_22649 [Blattamonas nauphoetae]|uniref:Uncharacterized protein n=1 Tax=Blattamonas nauphoetae TaxID=2049346 RepID=A0ABQ9WVG2_9EUKA|nr:hypothetical protein BLNAU_22649 [Blattamonas nauphoetae]
MTVATGNEGGGAAIFLHRSSSSLTITACFFHKCTCTGDGDDGEQSTSGITSTPTIKSVTVSFNGNEATVKVETTKPIKGTMAILLNGSNVPRLVHVVFGDDKTSSNLGTIVVSSGENEILPRADYVFRSAAVTGYRIIVSLGPFILEASSTLKDWNTTSIVVSGVNMKKGSYWMLVEKGGKEWNITLTHSDSTTLIGTATLYQSTAKDRQEWSTEYEVTKVMWIDLDGLTSEEVTLSNTITSQRQLNRLESHQLPVL